MSSLDAEPSARDACSPMPILTSSLSANVEWPSHVPLSPKRLAVLQCCSNRNRGEARREKRADRLPRPTPGRSLRSIIPKNKRKLGFCRADCQSGLFSSRAFPPRKVLPVEYLRNLKFFDCATPSGRLRIHPYFGAAVVLGGVYSPSVGNAINAPPATEGEGPAARDV
jgi:hypothetical protein